MPRAFAARSADVVLITPADNASAAAQVAEIVAARRAAGRTGVDHVFGELVVLLDDDRGAGRRSAGRSSRTGRASRYTSDAEVFVGTPQGLADLLLARAEAGLTGFRLRPAALPQDLDAIVDGLVPELQRRGAFRTAYEAGTLRDRLGLERPANRYATDEDTR